jgi:hypothetical protein
MAEMSRTTTIGLSLLLVGVITGAAGAHAVQILSTEPTSILGSSLFTLETGEAVNFNVTFQAGRDAPAARVLLQLLDANGAAVARRDVTLEPGRSATLRYGLPGVLRAQAQIIEPTPTDQSLVLSTIEIFGINDPKSLDLDLKSRRRFVCSSDDGAGPGRNPDSH